MLLGYLSKAVQEVGGHGVLGAKSSFGDPSHQGDCWSSGQNKKGPGRPGGHPCCLWRKKGKFPGLEPRFF